MEINLGTEKISTSKGFLVYLDVLGYTNYLRYGNKTTINALHKLINRLVNDSLNNIFEKNILSKVKRKAFSDNFVIFVESSEIDEKTFVQCCYATTYFQTIAILYGFLLRGSIVYGEVAFEENIIFGKPIVEAYELEQVSHNPEITLSPDLYKIYRKPEILELNPLSPFGIVWSNDNSFVKDYKHGIVQIVRHVNEIPFVSEKTINKIKWIVNVFNNYFEGVSKRLVLVVEPLNLTLKEE